MLMLEPSFHWYPVGRSLLAVAAIVFAVHASADELQKQRSAHDRAVGSVEHLVARILDVQLQQLEVNGLDTRPVFRELRASRMNLDALMANEMSELKASLSRAQAPTEAPSESRRLARRIVVSLLAERARVRKRLGGLADRDSQPAEELLEGEALAERVQQLQDLGKSLDDLLDKQDQAKKLAEEDAAEAGRLEKSIAEDLQEADDKSVLDDEIESRLDQAQDAATKAAEQLQDGSQTAGDQMQAVEAAEDALTEARVEVESQLSDMQQALESGASSESATASDGVSKNQPSSGTTRDLGSGATSSADQEIASTGIADEAWFVRLPPELQSAIRARSRRPPPRGYEQQLRDYFRHNN